MNQPLNRKQVALLVLATALGVSSFWIPVPEQSSATTPIIRTVIQAKQV